MGRYECQRCGDSYEVAADGDAFTTITVSYHDSGRADWSESVCQECGDELLDVIVGDLEVEVDG